jgi:hypothetical protein
MQGNPKSFAHTIEHLFDDVFTSSALYANITHVLHIMQANHASLSCEVIMQANHASLSCEVIMQANHASLSCGELSAGHASRPRMKIITQMIHLSHFSGNTLLLVICTVIRFMDCLAFFRSPYLSFDIMITSSYRVVIPSFCRIILQLIHITLPHHPFSILSHIHRGLNPPSNCDSHLYVTTHSPLSQHGRPSPHGKH